MKNKIVFCLILFVLFFISVFPVGASSNNIGNGQWLAVGKTTKVTCAWNSLNRTICINKIPAGTIVYIIQVAGTYTYYLKYQHPDLKSLFRTWVTVSDVQILYYCNYNKTPGKCKDFTK